MCSGHCPSSLLHINTFTHLIGCCKVQRCGLDTLGALSVYEGEAVMSKPYHKYKRYPYQYTQYFCINTLNKWVDTWNNLIKQWICVFCSYMGDDIYTSRNILLVLPWVIDSKSITFFFILTINWMFLLLIWKIKKKTLEVSGFGIIVLESDRWCWCWMLLLPDQSFYIQKTWI